MKSIKRHSRCAGSGEAGFTIIEMLVGLALTAIVASLLLVGITQFQPVRERNKVQTQKQELHAAADYIERVVSDHRNLALLENNPQRAAFIGEEKRMRFVAVVSTGSDLRQLRDVSIEAINIGGKLSLQQQVRPRRLSSDQSMAETTAVISGLSGVQFEYLNPEGNWSDYWPASQQFPAAIRVTLKRDTTKTEIYVVRLIGLAQLE